MDFILLQAAGEAASIGSQATDFLVGNWAVLAAAVGLIIATVFILTKRIPDPNFSAPVPNAEMVRSAMESPLKILDSFPSR